MKSDIFIPKTLKVGFDERDDTYTGKLAYVTYIDSKGVLRKEVSWNTWRDEDIDPLEVENVPTSGFVLNKKAGGYSTGWNHRQAYIRIYDPREFEFEITVENLLYILENTNCIKGKGLEGEFVYGWSGKDLILIPTASPDYQELQAFNDLMHSKQNIKAKDMVLGATYITKQNEHAIYLGKFESYKYNGTSEGKKHFFCHVSDDDFDDSYRYFFSVKTLSQKIIGVVDEEPVSNYANIMDKLERDTSYSPIDHSKDEFVRYTLEEFTKDAKEEHYLRFYNNGVGKYLEVSEKYNHPGVYEVESQQTYTTVFEGTIEDIFNKYNPTFLNKYLANGKLYESKTYNYSY